MEVQLSHEQEEQIRLAWEIFDTDKSGFIDTSELRDVLKLLGLTPTEDDLIEIIKDIDKDDDGTIDYREFLLLMSLKMKDS